MKNSFLFLLSLLCIALHSLAYEVDENRIHVSIIHDDSESWKAFFNQQKEVFNGLIAKKMIDIGFHAVEVNNCSMDANKNVSCDESFVERAILHMNIYISKIRQGTPKKGLSVVLDLSNQREQKKTTTAVIPITCRLSEGQSDQLIAFSRVEQLAQHRFFFSDNSAQYVAERLFSACRPLIDEQAAISLVKASEPDHSFNGIAVEWSDIETELEKMPRSNEKNIYILHTMDDTIEIELGRGQKR